MGMENEGGNYKQPELVFCSHEPLKIIIFFFINFPSENTSRAGHGVNPYHWGGAQPCVHSFPGKGSSGRESLTITAAAFYLLSFIFSRKVNKLLCKIINSS